MEVDVNARYCSRVVDDDDMLLVDRAVPILDIDVPPTDDDGDSGADRLGDDGG